MAGFRRVCPIETKQVTFEQRVDVGFGDFAPSTGSCRGVEPLSVDGQCLSRTLGHERFVRGAHSITSEMNPKGPYHKYCIRMFVYVYSI